MEVLNNHTNLSQFSPVPSIRNTHEKSKIGTVTDLLINHSTKRKAFDQRSSRILITSFRSFSSLCWRVYLQNKIAFYFGLVLFALVLVLMIFSCLFILWRMYSSRRSDFSSARDSNASDECGPPC